MARIRYLKPDFFKDEDLATLPYETRLFFAGLWGLADKAGRLEDRPLRLKAEVFPYDKVDIEKCLQQLAKPKSGSGQPFINRYQTDGQRYIQIINWDKHQKPHHTEAESKIPPAPPLMVNGVRTKENAEITPTFCAPLSNGEVTVKTPKPSYSEEFQEFWKLWPGRYNIEMQKTSKVGKAEAAKVWLRMSAESRLKVLSLVRVGSIKTAGTKYLPDAFRWLEKKRWEDFT